MAARLSALVDRWNTREDQMIRLLVQPSGDVIVTDASGTDHSLPSFPQLSKTVGGLMDSLTGAIAQAQALNAQTVFYANSAITAATAADASATTSTQASGAAKDSADSATASANAAASSATSAKAAETNAKASDTSANAAKTASAASAIAAAAQADNAGFSAAAAQTYRDQSATSKSLAAQYANAPVNVQVESGMFSAFHWSEQARLIAAGALIYRGVFSAASGNYPATPKLGDFYLISAPGTLGGIAHKTGDMMLYDGSTWDRIDNQQTVTSVAGRTGAVTLSTADIGGLQSALDAKASLTNPTFTGEVTFSAAAPLHFTGMGTNGTCYLHGLNGVGDDIVSFQRTGVSNYVTVFNGILIGSSDVRVGSNSVWHAGNFNPAGKQAALGFTPVQQGTGIGQSTNVVKIGWNNASKIKITVDATDLGAVAMETWVGSNYLPLSGTAANASSLGGVAATWFVQRNAVNQSAGMTFASAYPPDIAHIDSTGNSRNVALQVSNGGNTASPAVIGFIREGQFGAHFGLDTDNQWKVGGWSMGGVAYRLLHEGLTNPVLPGSLRVTNGLQCQSLNVNGTVLSQDSGIRVEGHLRIESDLIRLWATRDGWERQPRIFVRGADPGVAASDGDLWIW